VARPVSAGNLLEHVPAWSGYVVAFLTAVTGIYFNKRKGDIDESTMVLGAWKNLVEQHQTDIKSLKEDFAAYKRASTDEFAAYKATAIAEIADLRQRLAKAEGRIGELETENTGLKRAIAQNSQSTAYQLGRNRSDDEMVDKLDRAGHNLKGATE